MQTKARPCPASLPHPGGPSASVYNTVLPRPSSPNKGGGRISGTPSSPNLSQREEGPLKRGQSLGGPEVGRGTSMTGRREGGEVPEKWKTSRLGGCRPPLLSLPPPTGPRGGRGGRRCGNGAGPPPPRSPSCVVCRAGGARGLRGGKKRGAAEKARTLVRRRPQEGRWRRARP